MLERLQWLSRERFVLTSFTAPVCAALGDLDDAVAELAAAAEARCPWLFQMLADPRLEPIRCRQEIVKIEKTLERMEAVAEKKTSHEL
jgi:hypothetical protein